MNALEINCNENYTTTHIATINKKDIKEKKVSYFENLESKMNYIRIGKKK